jgi:hypothetical protein
MLAGICTHVISLVVPRTVAYAFVPYGELLRERTDIVVGITLAAMLIGAVGGGGDPLFHVAPLARGAPKDHDAHRFIAVRIRRERHREKQQQTHREKESVCV